MLIWALLAVAVILLACIRRVQPSERAVVLRLGRRTSRVIGPGFCFAIPVLERLDRVSIEPLSVSLPPQSAITRDEIPIQLQASLDAAVRNPELAVGRVRDWRIHLMGQLQDLMKEKLEDIEFDDVARVFPEWIASIRSQMEEKATAVGVRIIDLKISNLSPRVKPTQ